jgi:hypothetical protein
LLGRPTRRFTGVSTMLSGIAIVALTMTHRPL